MDLFRAWVSDDGKISTVGGTIDTYSSEVQIKDSPFKNSKKCIYLDPSNSYQYINFLFNFADLDNEENNCMDGDFTIHFKIKVDKIYGMNYDIPFFVQPKVSTGEDNLKSSDIGPLIYDREHSGYCTVWSSYYSSSRPNNPYRTQRFLITNKVVGTDCHSYCFTRKDGTFRVFIDGILVGTSTNYKAQAPYCATLLNINADNTSDRKTAKYFDDLVLIKGKALYTDSYSYDESKYFFNDIGRTKYLGTINLKFK